MINLNFWLGFPYRRPHQERFARIKNWYRNLSIHWSKREQELQAGVARTHKAIGDRLIKTTDDVDWGDETDSADPILPQALESRKLYP